MAKSGRRGRLVVAIVLAGLISTLMDALVLAEELAYDVFEPRKVIIAVVRDGPSPHFDRLTEKVTEELALLTGVDFEVYFKEADRFNAQWRIPRVSGVLGSALGDPEADIVLAAGALVTHEAARSSLKLTKPVVGGVMLDADAAGLPYDESGRSTKPNLNFIVTNLRISRDLETFHALIPFGKLHMLIDSKLMEGLENLDERIEHFEKGLGFPIEPVPMDERAQSTLNRLSDDVEAVYLTPPFRMSPDERRQLIEGFIARKIPSFSLMGHEDVKRGVLAGLTPESLERMARRIALNLHQIMLGVSPSELSVKMPLEEELLINAQTASEIGYSPSFETMMTADFIKEEALEKGEPLDVEKAMEIAAGNNIDLSIQKDRTETALQEKNQARSFMFPQVDSGLEYLEIDRDRAEASFGSQPQRRTNVGFSAQQMIFDDEIISNYRSSKRLYRGSVMDEESTRLDVMETAALRYLTYLEARALLKTERDNLRLTRSNLELARVRRDVGISGPEEVYRWEANEARQKASVLDARSREERARVALNQTLGVDQRVRWKPEGVRLKGEDSYLLTRRIDEIVGDAGKVETFRQFAVQFAFENEPTLKSIRESIEAQRIQMAQLKRRFGLPTFTTGFDLDHEVSSKTIGDVSSLDGGAGASGLDFNSEDETDWSWSIQVSLPLFEGGKRFHDVARARSELNRLKNTRIRLKQLIEQDVQSSVYDLQSSYPNIRLTRRSADRAMKNLDVVRDKYARGTVPIIDLLDAQNQAFVTELSAVVAVYTYLQDLFRLQRSLSWFESTKTEQEREAFLDRLEAYMEGSTPELPTFRKSPGKAFDR